MTETRKPTEPEIDEWLARCQRFVEEYYKKTFPTLQKPRLTKAGGKRYLRIALLEGRETDSQSSYCWAFVDLTNGDILRPAGWKGPSKEARGNIFDEHKGMSLIGPYGPSYLR